VTTFTTAQLLTIAPRARETYRDAFARTEVLAAAGMFERPLRLAHFLAQVCHETGGLTVIVENLHYSAERLMVVWPTRFATRAVADVFAGKPQALANAVYGGRMGNVDPDDGWRFIGRGLLQLTGRESYERIGRALGLDLVGQPYLAASAEHALAVAVELWRQKKCDAPADADDLARVTRAINGGLIGLADRRAWLQKAKALLEVS
jgi:putative chitinase